MSSLNLVNSLGVRLNKKYEKEKWNTIQVTRDISFVQASFATWALEIEPRVKRQTGEQEETGPVS